MSVAVVVPWRPGCEHRERAWDYVRRRYVEQHPDWEVVEAPAAEGGPWCKAAAVAPVVEALDAEIVIQADADCFTDGLPDAVEAVAGGAPWAIPHQMVLRLSEQGTENVLAGAEWADQPLAQRPYPGVAGGGFVVATADVLRAVPLDSRYKQWGQEDESHAIALTTLVGEPWRGEAPLIHLWHPPQERMTRRRGSAESWSLRRRYSGAREDFAAMAELVEEGRVDREAHEAGHHPAPSRIG